MIQRSSRPPEFKGHHKGCPCFHSGVLWLSQCFHLVCTGLAAVATSSVVQRLLGGLECWGGKQGSSRRACSPAETRHNKNILGRTCGASAAAASKRVVVEADLDLLLKHVDLVLLLYQLLLLFGDLRHKRHVSTCWYLCYLALRRENQHLLSQSWWRPQL